MKKFIIISVSVIALVYISYRIFRIATHQKGLKEKITNGAIILDVRTVNEFNTGHIEGSINIPLSKLHADSLPLDKTKTYITCCSHGLRSVKAVALLKERGFTAFNGGAWTDLKQFFN